MDYKKSFWAYYIGLFGGCLIIMLGCTWDLNWFIIGIGLIIILAAHIQVGIYYKCPHCNTYLNIRTLRPKHCPECGHKIDWDEENQGVE